jgi:hypothetical protein
MRKSKATPFAEVHAFLKSENYKWPSPYTSIFREVPEAVVTAMGKLTDGEVRRIEELAKQKPGWLKEVLARRGLRAEVI